MLIAATAVLLGVLMIKHDLSTDSGPPPQPMPAAAQPSTPAPVVPSASSASPSPEQGSPVMKRSQPLRIKIPRIKVDAPFIGLSLDASGVLQVPPPRTATWPAGTRTESPPAPGATRSCSGTSTR